jgi:hypothetical protein
MDDVSKTVKVEEEKVGDEVVQTRSVESASNDSSRHAANKGIQIVYYLAGVLALLIGIRFILFLLGARNVGVFNILYQVTQPFVAPFYGIFGNTVTYGSSRLEMESILAVIAIGVVTFIIAGFVRLLK